MTGGREAVTVDRVLAVLSRWYPSDDIVVTPVGRGSSTPVFRVEANGEVGFARLGEYAGDRRVGEITAHRHLVALGLPVPRILDYEHEPPELDRSIVLTTRIPGIPLADVSETAGLEEVGYAAGITLAWINRAPVNGYGWAMGITDDAMLRAEHATRQEWTTEYVDAVARLGASGCLPSGLADRARAAVEAWAVLPDDGVAHLAHGDLDATHIYIDETTRAFTGIIDLGEIRGADRLYDLGHLLLHDGEAGRPAVFPHVLDGYREVEPLPDDVMARIRLQAIAIVTRAAAIQLDRPPGPYLEWLLRRLEELAGPDLLEG